MGSLFSSCIKPSHSSGGHRLGSGSSHPQSHQAGRVPSYGAAKASTTVGVSPPIGSSGSDGAGKIGGSSPPLPSDRETRAQLMAAKVKEREEERKNRGGAGARQGTSTASKLAAASSMSSEGARDGGTDALPSGLKKGDWN